jgi:hypothetical protein
MDRSRRRKKRHLIESHAVCQIMSVEASEELRPQDGNYRREKESSKDQNLMFF